MKDVTKCFIKNNHNQYIEFSYAELLQYISSKSYVQNRWFIPVQGMLLEITQEEYKEHYRQLRRQKYLREEAARVGEVSYQQLKQLAGYDCIIDYTIDVEQHVINKVTLQMKLEQLSQVELNLIRAVYYYREKEHDIARKLGISQQAVHKRLKKILEKLKKI